MQPEVKSSVLLSVKPIFAQRIIGGSKKFEYRKRIFKDEVRYIYFYVSSPIKKVFGFSKYRGYIADDPLKMWQKTDSGSGLTKSEYFDYANNCVQIYAIHIIDFELFEPMLELQNVFPGVRPPQSFCYVQGGGYEYNSSLVPSKRSPI